MKIEIIAGFEAPQSRTVNGRDGQAPREVFSQTAFAHLGGPFPVQIRLPLESMQAYYQVGKYHLSDDSFRVGQYGDLQINPYGIKLLPIVQDAKKVS